MGVSGGKVEDGEPVRAALARELEEELGIRVERARPLIQVRHDYADKHVLLDVWEVDGFSGEAHGAEGQPLAWVEPRELADYEFPAANAPIVQAARLPAHYLITPDGLEPGELISGVRKAVEAGIRLIQLRAPNMFSPEYRDLAIDIQGLCAGKAQLMLKGPLEWLGDFPAAGWHLTSAQLRKYASAGRPFPKGACWPPPATTRRNWPWLPRWEWSSSPFRRYSRPRAIPASRRWVGTRPPN